MMRRAGAVLGVLVAGAPALAALVVLEAPPEDWRPGRRFAYVCDVSGSMSGPRLGAALRGFQELASQPSDEMEMAVLAFDGRPKRWPGRVATSPEERLPAQPRAGWTALPDAGAVAQAVDWLDAQALHGQTLLAPAIKAALAEPVTELTVVVISDGEWQDAYDIVVFDAMGRPWVGPGAIRTAIEEGQRQRVAAGWGRAAIACVHVGAPGEESPEVPAAMRAVAKLGGGGLYGLR